MRHLPSYLILLALSPVVLVPAEAPAHKPAPIDEMIFRPSCLTSMQEHQIVEHEEPHTGRTARSRPAQALGHASPTASPPPPPMGMPVADHMAEAGPSRPPASVKTKKRETRGQSERAIGPRVPQPEPPVEVVHRVPMPSADGPDLDWGGTTYLSNDDSMSLASAQRVLYAAMNKTPLSVSEIRPHELLNYFSFDTLQPARGELFEVHSSARVDGDSLQVAFSVQGASPERQPLDLTNIIDVSCSMASEGRMDYTRRGLKQMTEQLRTGDRLGMVLFDGRACRVLENFVVGRDDQRVLQQVLDGMRPMGGTNVDLGLRVGYEMAKDRTEAEAWGRNRRMMLLTDAQMNLGNVNVHTVTEVAKAYEEDGIRLTGVGVGSGFRDDVLNMLTEKGKGAYVYLGSEAVVDRIFGQGFDSLVQTIAHDVQFKLELPPNLAMERFYGEESSTVAADIQPIHYYAGTSQVFLQDLKMRDGRPVHRDPVKLTMSWRDAVTGEPASRTFRTTVGQMLETDAHNVDKAHALMKWTDLLLADAMGSNPCGKPLRAYQDAVSRVSHDAEIDFVSGLVGERCPRFVPTFHSAETVSYKVRVDSDIPIAEVGLTCEGRSWSERTPAGTHVATFDATPGSCTLTLQGNVAMRVPVEVPSTGGDARCVVRGGRVSCG